MLLAARLVRLSAAMSLLCAAPAAELPYRFLHVNFAVGNPAEGPAADAAQWTAVTERFRGQLASARQLGYNHVLISGLENYVPDDEPARAERARRFRPYLEAAIGAAHAQGLKLVLYGDEAIYRPEWLERTGAKASVKDAGFWQILADKYRRLLTAFPDLDGVAVRVGEVIPYHGFESLDLLHSPESEPNPRVEERFRRFVLTAHRVVAGEFGKLLVCRTWTTSDWEQHSVPEIFRAVFSSDVPTRNLLVSIKLTKQDAWYYGSAFNPTFGQTPHATIAEAELYSQYHGLGTMLDFPAPWFAAALRYACSRGLQGVMAGEARSGLLGSGMLAVFSRLAQDPEANEQELTRAWVAAEFGRAAAGAITEILLASGAAIRETFYLPAFPALGWNPLPHVRVNRIVARGDPFWDEGRGHDEFLRDIYLISKPYLEQTRESVTRGHQRFAELAAKFAGVREQVENAERREELQQMLAHSLAASALLRDYVHTILSYFEYREQASASLRNRLAADYESLRTSAENYRRHHRFYDLAGVEVTLKLVSRMLEDRERAEQILRQAPTRQQLAARFAAARQEHLRLLAADPGAEKFLSWRGTVDARAMLRIRGSEVRVEPLAGDGLPDQSARFYQPVVVRTGGRWLIKPIRARGVIHLFEEPSPANGGVASVYVDDPAPGNAVYEFELYWSRAGAR